MSRVTKFIKSLQDANVEEARNIYMGNSRESQIRRHNLNLYLNYMKTQKPKVLFVGKAPGNGCGLTGIPFTSEYILKNNIFFANRDFQFINKELQKGPSATMVWECLEKYESKPLIWNIYPFYPRKKNGHLDKDEIDFGTEFLLDLLEIFPIQKIAAVGEKAQSGLKKSDLSYQNVRQPIGGKAKFNEDIDKIMNEL